MLLATRILLYIQFLLGITRFLAKYLAVDGVLGFALNRGIWEIHFGLAILIAIFAIIALRPRSNVPQTGLRTTARFFALLPLVVGLAMRFGGVGGIGVVVVHMILGIITIALVEMASGRQRRAERAVPA